MPYANHNEENKMPEKPVVSGNIIVNDLFDEDHSIRFPVGPYRVECIIRKVVGTKTEEIRIWDGSRDVTSQFFEAPFNYAEIRPTSKNLMLVFMHLYKEIDDKKGEKNG